MGPWDLSLALLPSQLTALLIKGKHGPAVGCRGGQTISLVTLTRSQVLSPLADSHALSPFQIEFLLTLQGPPAVTSSKKPTLIPNLGYTLPLASLSPSHDPGFCVVS